MTSASRIETLEQEVTELKAARLAAAAIQQSAKGVFCGIYHDSKKQSPMVFLHSVIFID